MHIKKKHQGSFAYEVIVCGLALILLCGMMLDYGSTSLTQGKITKATAQAATIGGYIGEYNMEIGSYPESLDDLTKSEGQYSYWIKSIPMDPWGHAYVYQHNDDGFAIFSLGENGVNDGSSPTAIANGDIGYIGK